jgi:hypothetical protein
MTDTNPWRSTGAERTNWRDHAACSRLDPDLFFPVSTSGASLTDIEAAKRVCRRCPVLTACLLWGPGPRTDFRHLGRHHRARTPRPAARTGAALTG